MRKLVYTALALIISFNLWAQEKRIIGKITDEQTNEQARKVSVIDTVGSGDAFLAGLLSNLENVSAAKALEFASELGAFIATKRGASPAYDIEELNDFIKNDDIKV